MRDDEDDDLFHDLIRLKLSRALSSRRISWPAGTVGSTGQRDKGRSMAR